jgi:GNAT superfamily N-acetyltransferase
MNKPHILDLYDQNERINVEYPGARREVTPDVVRHVDTSGRGEGMILYSHLSAANAEAVIRQQIDYFESLGQDLEWKVYDYDAPPDLKERLASHGFIIEAAEALMLIDLAGASPAFWQPVGPLVQRLTDPEKLADVQTIQQQVWDEDSAGLIDYLGESLRKVPERMSIYVAYVDGQPASAAWVYFPEHSQFASLWGGSTIKEFRRQGLYGALLRVRAQEARQRQVRFLTVYASPMSRPILEKAGFELLAWSYPCKWKHKS